MAIMKLTGVFAMNTFGWTESHFKTVDADINLGTLLEPTKKLMQARAQLMGLEARVIGWRMAMVRPDKGALPHEEVFGGLSTVACDSPDACVNVRFTDNTARRGKTMWLRGIPDEISISGGKLQTDMVPGYANKFNAWFELLKSQQYGWLGILNTVDSPIAGIVNGATGIIDISLQENIFPAPTFQKQVKARISGVNGKSVLNGQWIVRPINGGEFQIVPRVAATQYVSGGRVFYSTYGVIPYAAAAPLKVTSRHMGAPLLQGPGRAKARVRT